MGLFPDLKTNERKTVSEPDGMELFKGLAWMAAGLVGISFWATSVIMMWEMIFGALGLVFWGIGGRWIGKYASAYKAFRKSVPTWDPERGMYDEFAQELNAWHRDDIPPACCDGDMSLRTWWINYSENQGKVRKTGDCIDVELSRNVAVMEPPGFSITSVACPSCGGSFDAVRQKVCPCCGGEYHMENEGWVIDDMCLIR